MINRREADRIRERLLAVLDEDARNTQRLLSRLDSITDESGISAHSALLLILTHLAFEEEEARGHWEAIVVHREAMTEALGRDAGIRTAMLDYFTNINRRLVQPTLIDLKMNDSFGQDDQTDALTGLSSDRRLRSALQGEIRRAKRYDQRAAVIVADADDFAEVNREFGTLLGDRILRELAMIVNNNIRDIDLAARAGEDEMVLLLPETDRNGALLVAERFRREVESFFSRRESGGKPVGLTISAGVACYPDDASTPETLLERAAQALYQAKASGRNAVHLYHAERRRYLRFDLEPGRFEIEVLGRPGHAADRLRNLSRNGVLFSSPEALEVGEEIEIRVIESSSPAIVRPLRIRGTVVRLEQLPPAGSTPQSEGSDRTMPGDCYEVGVALDLEWAGGADDLLDFLQKARGRHPGEDS
jgi:diguanylate cyclase (GGDEF)-like protein